jgi:hypothetical protein
MSEVEQTPAEPTPELEAVDYSQESLEELEARMQAGEALITEQVDEPEPEAEVVVTPEGEPAEPVEAEAKPEEVVVEEPVVEEEEFDEKASYLEEQKLQTELAEAKAKQFESLVGRNAGENDFLRKRLETLEQLLAQQQPQPPADPYAETPQVQQPRPVQTGTSVDQSRLAELENSARAAALEQEYSSFLATRELVGEAGTKFTETMGPAIQASLKPYEQSIRSMSPTSLKGVFRNALDTAYAEFSLREVRSRREKYLEKKASQVPERKIAKQAASVSGSGGTPTPKPTVKRPEDMTGEDADKALIKEFGDGTYRRPRA